MYVTEVGRRRGEAGGGVKRCAGQGFRQTCSAQRVMLRLAAHPLAIRLQTAPLAWVVDGGVVFILLAGALPLHSAVARLPPAMLRVGGLGGRTAQARASQAEGAHRGAIDGCTDNNN